MSSFCDRLCLRVAALCAAAFAYALCRTCRSGLYRPSGHCVSDFLNCRRFADSSANRTNGVLFSRLRAGSFPVDYPLAGDMPVCRLGNLRLGISAECAVTVS